jgi:hypothetical protein
LIVKSISHKLDEARGGVKSGRDKAVTLGR